jgi:hypothetical protein
MSRGSGSSSFFSSGFAVSSGRLFFFWLVVGGCRRDWEKVRFAGPAKGDQKSIELGEVHKYS